jgi:hypothetical protein
MRSKRKQPAKAVTTSTPQSYALIAFYPILVLTLVLWLLYRTLFDFPVWFDEIFGKALFFGFPVWLYITISGFKVITDSFAPYKIQSGLLLGIAAGGIFGFTTSIVSLFQTGATVESVWLLSSDTFWQEFILALFTGFWETILFYSFVMTVIQEKYPKWPVLNQSLLTAGIALLFYIPNAFSRFDPLTALGQLFLLFLFALGQAYLFQSRHNGYALVLSHAIWGMVLLTHSW